MPKLQINIPEGETLKFELNLDSFTIGRADSNDIEINDASMSGSHAELTKDGGNFRLVDLDSTNGTKVNGEKITEHFLADGDQVQFGNVPAVYTSEVSAEAAASSSGSSSSSTKSASDVAASDAWDDDEESSSGAVGGSSSAGKSGLATVANTGFGSKPKKKDPIAALLFTLGTFAILACIGAVLMAFQMAAN